MPCFRGHFGVVSFPSWVDLMFAFCVDASLSPGLSRQGTRSWSATHAASFSLLTSFLCISRRHRPFEKVETLDGEPLRCRGKTLASV